MKENKQRRKKDRKTDSNEEKSKGIKGIRWKDSKEYERPIPK
jgi:hypothetical protein